LPHFERCDYLFSINGKTPVNGGFTRAKIRIDALMQTEIPALPRWTFHDIRRSVATNLQKLGVRLEVTEAILGHTGSRAGIVGVYQKHHYSPEKRAGLEAWARRLDVIVTGTEAANVVELKARG
jgi:hypothetical protein